MNSEAGTWLWEVRRMQFKRPKAAHFSCIALEDTLQAGLVTKTWFETCREPPEYKKFHLTKASNAGSACSSKPGSISITTQPPAMASKRGAGSASVYIIARGGAAGVQPPLYLGGRARTLKLR
jgi:hypothetical protein